MSSYLGVPPQSGFITTAKQRITSSTNNYVDLDHSISSLADVIVWVNFVKQDSTNLTLTTSTRITLGGTLVASDVVEIAYLGKAVATQTPSSGTVTNDMLAGSIANSKLANSSITLNGSSVSLGGSATVGGDNTPALWAYQGSAQNVSPNTDTIITFNQTFLNSGGTFDASNYRWTPGTAGYYQFNISVFGRMCSDSGSTFTDITLQRDGSSTDGGRVRLRPSTDTNQSISFSGIVYSSASHYFDVMLYHQNASTQATDSNNDLTFWQMYKIIT